MTGPADERLGKIMAAARSAAPDDACNELCRCCVRVFPVEGAAVSLVLSGTFDGVLGASDAHARRLEGQQFTVGEGPSIDADRRSLPVQARWPEDGHRWPLFSAAAEDAGLRSMVALPLQAGAAKFGALSVHGHRPAPLELSELAGLEGTARVATEWILHTLAAMRGSHLPPAVEAMYQDRAVVHQAAGMLSVTLSISIADALIALRAHAFAIGRPLEEIAEGVVDGTAPLDGLGA